MGSEMCIRDSINASNLLSGKQVAHRNRPLVHRQYARVIFLQVEWLVQPVFDDVAASFKQRCERQSGTCVYASTRRNAVGKSHARFLDACKKKKLKALTPAHQNIRLE